MWFDSVFHPALLFLLLPVKCNPSNLTFGNTSDMAREPQGGTSTLITSPEKVVSEKDNSGLSLTPKKKKTLREVSSHYTQFMNLYSVFPTKCLQLIWVQDRSSTEKKKQRQAMQADMTQIASVCWKYHSNLLTCFRKWTGANSEQSVRMSQACRIGQMDGKNSRSLEMAKAPCATLTSCLRLDSGLAGPSSCPESKWGRWKIGGKGWRMKGAWNGLRFPVNAYLVVGKQI